MVYVHNGVRVECYKTIWSCWRLSCFKYFSSLFICLFFLRCAYFPFFNSSPSMSFRATVDTYMHCIYNTNTNVIHAYLYIQRFQYSKGLHSIVLKSYTWKQIYFKLMTYIKNSFFVAWDCACSKSNVGSI